MPLRLENYIDVVGDSIIAELHRKARKLYNKRIIHFNSTFLGGGVAEILSRLIPMKNDLGIDAGWRVLHGNSSFYDLTKKFHNGLQGAKTTISPEEKQLYVGVNEEFASYTHINHDCVVVHDPQPLPFISFYKKRQPWIWRCHIDISEPDPTLYCFLKKFMLRYDVVIFSTEQYRKKDLPVDQRIIAPAIDPLVLKNRDMSQNEIAQIASDAGIPLDKPIITQVSRMDKWKDPEGVLDIYEKVRQKIDCRLLYCYNLATDDPEGMDIYTRLYNKAKSLVDAGDVIFIMGSNERLVNAVQRMSSVIVQKSIREGFCLCVTESLWKKKPVVASKVGGIPLQIEDGKSGYLVDPYDVDGFADRIIAILQNEKLAQELGENGKEMVLRKFLNTRLVGDYLDLINELTS